MKKKKTLGQKAVTGLVLGLAGWGLAAVSPFLLVGFLLVWMLVILSCART